MSSIDNSKLNTVGTGEPTSGCLSLNVIPYDSYQGTSYDQFLSLLRPHLFEILLPILTSVITI